MGIFLLIVGVIIVVGVISALQTESRTHDLSSNNRSSSSSNNATDLTTTGALFSLQDTDQHDCSDNTSSHSDSSGSSSCD